MPTVGSCRRMMTEQLVKKLQALEHSLRQATGVGPTAVQKLTSAALEDIRSLIHEVVSGDRAYESRLVDNGTMLKGRRTRFFVEYAKHGIRLSALQFLLASHTERSWRAGKRSQQAGWRQTAEWFGSQIGVSGRQIYRLVQQGKASGLLDYVRSRRGMVIWIKNRKVYALSRGNEEDEFNVGHYHLRLARLLGINGSILYRFLKTTDEEGNRKRLTGQSAAHRFGWLSQRAASMELQRLFQAGAIQRQRAKFSLSANAEWAYYWRHRTQEDREKWRSHAKALSRNSYRNKVADHVTERQVCSQCGKTK